MSIMDGLHWETWEDPSERWPSDRLKAALVGDTPEDVKKARKSWLSISRAHDVAKCPAQHLGKSRLPRFFDPFAANELGTGAHEVMELFYQLPPAERTEAALKAIARDVANRYWDPEKLANKLPETAAVNELSREYWLSIVLEWSLGILKVEDPQSIEMIGSEWDFKGLPSSNGVVTVGSIDRVRRDLITGKIIVDDYKFGKWKGNPNPSFRDDYGMQGHWYKDVFETNNPGEVVTGVNLIYPRAPHTRQIDIAPEKVQGTLISVKQSRDDLQRYADEQRFPAKPSALCGWCDLAQSCPVARLKKDNALDSASKMPTASELNIPGGKLDDPAMSQRRAQVLAGEHAEREAAMALAVDKVKALMDQKTVAASAPAPQLESGGLNGQSLATFIAAETQEMADAAHADWERRQAAHSIDTTTNPGGTMSQDVQAPVQPQMMPQAAPKQAQVAVQQTPMVQQTLVDVQQAPAVQPAAQPAQRTPRVESYMKSSTNNEGELDLGSYAARNAAAVAEYAVYLISEAGFSARPARLDSLAKQLGRIARRIAFRYTGTQNMQSGAFTHSLYAMKEAIRYLQRATPGGPIPFGQNQESWSVWAGRVENMGIAILQTVDAVFLDDSTDTDLFGQLEQLFPANETAPFQAQ